VVLNNIPVLSVRDSNRTIPFNEKLILSLFIELIIVIGFAGVLSSCSSSLPEKKYIKPAPQKDAVVVRQFLPPGWANITSKSNRTEIKYWLVNRDFSATMVLRELQTDSSSQKIAKNGELIIAANISLLSKIPDNNSDYRVTRVPENIDTKRNFLSYAYSEKGLLRRVIVFKKQLQLFELELMQERSSSEFDELTNDLISFAVTLSGS
jgi:hypothetical protein